MSRFLAAVFWIQIAALAVGQSTATPKLILDFRAPRSEIRKRLLQYTPVGSKLADVGKFVSKELAKSGDDTVKSETPAPADKEAAKSPKVTRIIRGYLGQYYDQAGVIFLTAPLVSQREVSVEWLFDDHDALIDLVVTKKPTVY